MVMRPEVVKKAVNINDLMRETDWANNDGPTAKKTMTPIGSKVLIQCIKQRPKTSSGIVLPGNANRAPSILFETEAGWVIATGPDCKQLREGDKIYVRPGVPVQPIITMDCPTLMLMSEEDVGAFDDKVRNAKVS